VVLRLLILKHVRNWSYAVLEREVRANLVYRDFTRVGAAKMPDAETMGSWGIALGPAVIKQMHNRLVQIAQASKVVQGRKMRVDTTVVESNIHDPTDSSLLDDGCSQNHRADRCGRREVARSAPIFEPSTEVIRKGKASRPTEFGKLVKLQEAENQIIVDYEVYARRPNDSDLLMPAIEVHAAKLGCIPRLVAAGAGFYFRKERGCSEDQRRQAGLPPNRGSKGAARKPEQKKRWFRNGQHRM
jgi:hypothetical protein